MPETGLCGDNCNHCPRYLATQSGDEARLREVAAMWQMIGWHEHLENPGALACNGCSTVHTCGLGIRECVLSHGIDSCGRCPDFPCEKLLTILDDNLEEAITCRKNLSREDFDLFQRAFFSKQERLERIHNEYFRRPSE